MILSIGNKLAGRSHPCFVVAEIGINHNGDLKIAKRLIDIAREAGCDAVKFQIRNIDKLFSKEQLATPKESPWGTTYEDYVRGREFEEEEMAMLVYHTMQPNNEILWGASYWACEPSDNYPSPDFVKVQSAAIRDLEHIRRMASYKLPMIVSTGGASTDDIDKAVSVLERESAEYALMQCNSTYPSKFEELDLRVIETFKKRYACSVGYSGHEKGIAVSTCAVALGADIIERHITLDRTMWGTDHASSIEPDGLKRLIRDIRSLEKAFGSSNKRVYDSEIGKIKMLGRWKND